MAEWRREDVKKLIELFYGVPGLWDSGNPNYSKKHYRLKSLETLEEALDHKYTAEEINAKIKHLRSYYAKELAKVRKSTKIGSRTNDVYTSKWSHFKRLDSFLHNQITPRQSTRNKDIKIERDEDHIDDRKTREMEDDHNSGISKTKKQKSRPSAVMSEAVSVLAQLKTKMDQATTKIGVTNEEDEDTVFGRYLVNELRKIKNPSVKNAVRLKLQTVIFDAQGEETRSQVPDSASTTTTPQIWRPLITGVTSLQSGVQRSSRHSSFSSSDSNEDSQPP